MSALEVTNMILQKSKELEIDFHLLNVAIMKIARNNQPTLASDQLDEAIYVAAYKGLVLAEKELWPDAYLLPEQTINEFSPIVASIRNAIGEESLYNYHITVFVHLTNAYKAFENQYGSLSLSSFIKLNCREEINEVLKLIRPVE